MGERVGEGRAAGGREVGGSHNNTKVALGKFTFIK